MGCQSLGGDQVWEVQIGSARMAGWSRLERPGLHDADLGDGIERRGLHHGLTARYRRSGGSGPEWGLL